LYLKQRPIVYTLCGVDTIRAKKDSNSIRQRRRLVLQGLNHLLWPAVCANCRQNISETDNHLCGRCWAELLENCGGHYCKRCGRDASEYGVVAGVCPDCQGKDFRFDQIARAGVYSQSLRQMILFFKKGRTELDSVLSFLANSALEGAGFYNEIELFVPVPLHWSRRLVRGYNQALIIARRLNHHKADVSTELVRIRRTRAQPTMTSPAARARNVAGAFSVRRGHPFAGRNVCLVDDIKTSGATLNECAKTLKQAEASKVFALVLAVAGQKSG